MSQELGHGEKGFKPLKMHQPFLIALGSNLASAIGSSAETLCEALKYLNMGGAVIRAVSPFYHTPAFPAGVGPDYVNAAAVISAPWSAAQMLARLHEIEADMGRERIQRWGQRTLDLDMIGCGDLVLPDAPTYTEWLNLPLKEQTQQAPEQLILPHPRMQDRAFVLVPLADVAPDWMHPVSKQSVRQMLDALPDSHKNAVKPL